MWISVSPNELGMAVWQYALSMSKALGLMDGVPDPKSQPPPKMCNSST